MEYSDLKLNDGGGLYDREGMIDGLIMDCEEIMRVIMAGNGIRLAALLVEMVQKLSALKSGTAEEVARLTKERDDARAYADEVVRAMMKAHPPDQKETAEAKPEAETPEHEKPEFWEDV